MMVKGLETKPAGIKNHSGERVTKLKPQPKLTCLGTKPETAKAVTLDSSLIDLIELIR